MIVTPVELPTSNASVLWPSALVSPSVLSILMFVTARSVAPLILIICMGEFLKLRPVIDDCFKEWA